MARAVTGRGAVGKLSLDRGRTWRRWLGGVGEFAFVLPAIVLVGVFILGPSLVGLFRSFYEWNPGFESTFVGFENYLQLARSSLFHEILKNQAFFLLGIPLWTILPIALAFLLHERVAFAGMFRTIFFFPAVLSPAIIGILFRGVLAPDGLLNEALRTIGLGAVAQSWIDDPALVKPTLIVVLAWATVGLGVVIFSAALSSVPPELFEAAELDGAGWFQRLRYIVFPAIKPVVQFWLVYQVIIVFLGLFGWIFVLTRGGPGFSSTTIDFDVFQTGIAYGQFGLATAEAMYLLLIMLLLFGAAALLQRRRREA